MGLTVRFFSFFLSFFLKFYPPYHPSTGSDGQCNAMRGRLKEILAFRHSLWTSVSSRRHHVSKLYFGDSNDMMLHGTVVYIMKNDPQGKEIKIDWAAKAEFDELEGITPRMKFYQVYLV